MKRQHLILAIFALLLAVAATGVYAENRINMVHHFGGDALFCDEELGCWMLNMNGERLWEVDQASIDAAMATACETGVAQRIAAGDGTYGPMILEANCYGENGKMLKLIGYDEYGKVNEMPFQPNYAPVNPPAEKSTLYCQIDLARPVSFSLDYSMRRVEGYQVWRADEYWNPVEYQYTTLENPHLHSCNVHIA